VKAAVAYDRLNRLTALLAQRAEERLTRLVGSRVMIMVDSLNPEDAEENVCAVGRTEGQAPEVDGVTYVMGELPEGTEPGDEVLVTVRAVVGYDLLGTVDAS
jgi:ribosomal protein S12 methylthiotransferase